jgi:hypothetical protein
MKPAIQIFLLLAITAFSRTVSAQTEDTNILTFHFVPANNSAVVSAATNASSANNVSHANDIIPLVDMHDVPILDAIANLARQGHINYFVDRTLFPAYDAHGNARQQPLVDLYRENITARAALDLILHYYHLILLDDTVSNIAIITAANRASNPLFAGLMTNSLPPHTNQVPVIQFSEVPFSMGIENLAREAGLNCMIDPRIVYWGTSGAEYTLSLRLENVTAWSVLNRMLSIYGLVLIDDPVSHVSQITRPDQPRRDVNASILSIDSNQPAPATNNVIPLIEFKDVPLDEALESFIHQGSLPITLDSRITTPIDPHAGWYSTMPLVSIRWENLTAAQALVALCENYHLVIVKDTLTGLLKIEPTPRRRW